MHTRVSVVLTRLLDANKLQVITTAVDHCFHASLSVLERLCVLCGYLIPKHLFICPQYDSEVVRQRAIPHLPVFTVFLLVPSDDSNKIRKY